MNRIYQGKVTNVEFLVGKGEQGKPLDLDVLWRHHELFQDAVNYYLVCLLALANGGSEETRRIIGLRERLTTKRPDHPEDEQFHVWESFRRKGATRRGLRDSVAPYLCPGQPSATAKECLDEVLAGNSCAETDEGRALLDRGLGQLLSNCTGESGCRNAAPEFLPRFCKPVGDFTFEEDASRLRRDAQRPRLIQTLHDSTTRFASPALDEFGPHSIALVREGREIKGAKLKAKLTEFLAAWRERHPEPTDDWERLEKRITELADGVSIPDYAGTSAKGDDRFLLAAMCFFRCLEKTEFTFGLMKQASRAPKDSAKITEQAGNQETTSDGDPIRLARGQRGYVFRAFTSLPGWGGDGSGNLQWEKFDAAAFEEALKAIHQVDDRGNKRAQELAQKLEQFAFQHGLAKQCKSKAKGKKGEEVEQEAPPILVGDPRIERLETLLNSDLAEEYAMSEGEIRGYGLQERTIRGFRDLRKKWRAVVDPEDGDPRPYSAAARDELLAKLRDYQKENPEIVGSVPLFEALIDEPNWCIWRTTPASQLLQWKHERKLPEEANFAPDPLQALSDANELAGDLERLAPRIINAAKDCKSMEDLQKLGGRLIQPVRITPADAEYSRRQFYFSDVSDLTANERFRHDQHYLEVEIAMNTGAILERRWVRLHFAAPRLLRDQLTADGEPNRESRWQQAMMEALGLQTGLTRKGQPAELADCLAVALMPEVVANGKERESLDVAAKSDPNEYKRLLAKAEKRFLVNFVANLDPLAVQRQLLELKSNKELFRTKRDPLTKQLSFDSFWQAQMVASYVKRKLDVMFYLRWPALVDEEDRTEHGWWWERGKPFTCLPVDLGQRDAAAFALLEAAPGDPPKPPHSRKIGETGGKSWWATVRAAGMLRLPGEDAMVFRNGCPEPQEELSGERGRLSSPAEWDEARDICEKLGFVADKILGSECHTYSFPEQNDRLLYALRRAQARLARLQSWSCVAYEEKDGKLKESFERRRARIKEQINEAIKHRTEEKAKPEMEREQEKLERSQWLAEIEPLASKNAWDCVADRTCREIAKEREIIKAQLVRTADRIQPLRGRRWEWALRHDDTRCHVLRQTAPGSDPRPKLLAGQRGLSMKRLEQLDNLRQRCQSLNRALLQTPGEPAKLGRSKRGLELPDPCPELLDRLDNLKEQRVNQTAHLILAQALGVRLRPHQHDEQTRRRRDIHGEYERIPGRQPLDFIVIENLKYYEMTQGRSRRENVRLMKWCRRHLRDKLIELCEPYGIRVVEEWPADTSKFCSLTGVAGFRAVELTPDNREDFRWRKHLERLADPERAKKLDKEERQESERVKALFDALDRLNADLLANRPARPKWRTLVAPVAGGPIFVPMKGPCQQADINAAINLGLRAIAAPENQEIHVRIRSKRDGDKFYVRAENLREKARWGKTPPEIVIPDEKHRANLLTEAHPLFFADTGGIAGFDRAEINGKKGFASSRGIRGTVKQKDWLRVGALNNDRLEKAGWGRPLVEEDDVPM